MSIASVLLLSFLMKGGTPYERMQKKERLDHLGFDRCEALALLDKIDDSLRNEPDSINRHRVEPDRCAPIRAAWEADKTWLVVHEPPRGVRPFDLEKDEHPDFDANRDAEKIDKIFGFVSPGLAPAMPAPTPNAAPEHPAAAETQDEATPPRLLRKVDPDYPEKARKAKKQGVVVLAANISAEGDVRDVTVLRGLDPLLDAAAIESVRQWKYEPAVKNGKPTSVSLTVTVTFYLGR